MVKRTRRTRTEWEALVREQIESGKPAVQWCQDNAVSYKSLVRWRGKLNRESVGSVARSAQPAFVDVTEAVKSVPSPWLVELDLGAGVQLRIGRHA